MGYVESRKRSFTAGEAIAKHLRVKLSSGKIVKAGLADNDIGTIDHAVFADEDDAAVNLRNLQGTELAVAADAFDLGATLYTAAAGTVSDTAASTSYKRGIALEAATAAGDIVEILPLRTEDAVD